MGFKGFFKPNKLRVFAFVILIIAALWLPYLDLHYWTGLSFNYGVWVLNLVIYYIVASIIASIAKGWLRLARYNQV